MAQHGWLRSAGAGIYTAHSRRHFRHRVTLTLRLSSYVWVR